MKLSLFITSTLKPLAAMLFGSLICIAAQAATKKQERPQFTLKAHSLMHQGTHFRPTGEGLGIGTTKAATTEISTITPAGNSRFDIELFVVAEATGESYFAVQIGSKKLPGFSTKVLQEGQKVVSQSWKNVDVNEGETLTIRARNSSVDGETFSQAIWTKVVFTAVDGDPGKIKTNTLSVSVREQEEIESGPALAIARQANGDGSVVISGELKQWHPVTLTLSGPFAHEQDIEPNAFLDYRMSVTFSHESGVPSYTVPGYFAADGNAAETSADYGTAWRAHLSPDKTGTWSYRVSFVAGEDAAIAPSEGDYLYPYHNQYGTFKIAKTDKKGRDFRAKGRLEYVGGPYLRHAGNGEFFIKAGPDAPETIFAFKDFDNTIGMKRNLKIKTWEAHAQDFRAGDPTWQNGKGKNLIGALNYLADKGVNACSFLTYNAGGDGDNIWPYVERNGKFHFDCSKLDQWNIVFSHSQNIGLYLHFKLQENELDDNRKGARRIPKIIKESMDGGLLGPERKLYLREIIARFSHHLALNWNLGEENTQTYEEQRDMAEYVLNTDPYDHNIVIHSFPSHQERVYRQLLGNQSVLTGASLQNGWDKAHKQTLRWVEASRAAGKPWIVANDEQNPASQGVPPDPGYQGFDGFAKDGDKRYDLHGIRKYTLWGNLMAGGAGVEYYFGYRLPENDLHAQDFRSRDRSWEYAGIAIDFFKDHKIPVQRMRNLNALVGNTSADNSRYCLGNEGEIYLVYLPEGGNHEIDLSHEGGSFKVMWFNPRTGGKLQRGKIKKVKGGGKVKLGNPPKDSDEDWLVILRK